jgi:hypothetical protein
MEVSGRYVANPAIWYFFYDTNRYKQNFLRPLLFIDDIDRPVFEILADEHVQSQMNSQKAH